MSMLLYRVAPLLLLVAFSGLLGLWVVILRNADRGLERRANLVNTLLGWSYLLWMLLLVWYQHNLPILNAGQLIVFLGGLVWWGQGIAHCRVRQRILLLLPLSAVVLFLLAGVLFGLDAPAFPKALVEGDTALHIIIALAGMAMLLGSGVYGAGQFLLHRQLQRHSFGRWFDLLPSLEDLNRLRRFALLSGWLLITISLVTALLGTPSTDGTMGTVISHLHPVLLLWVILSLLLLADRLPRIASEHLAVTSFTLAVVILILLLISVVGIYQRGPV